MRNLALRLLALLLIAPFVGRLAGPARAAAPLRADSPISITTAPAVTVAFPNELTFTVSAKDATPITDIVLDYTLLPDGGVVRARAEFAKGTEVKATYHMRSNGNPLYLPPGKQVRYSWELTDANGAQLKTDPATATFADTRFQWQSVSAGNLTLYFYKGSHSDATSLLGVGRTAIDKASELENTQVDFPIKLFAYDSSQDFLPAAQKESKATDPGILGQALAPDTVIFVADSLSASETQDTVQHELTHIVTSQAVKGGFENLLPLWLNEGTSVYSQADPGDYGRALKRAIANDSVVPIQVLESSRGVDVGLFYGESYGLVKFLVESGGPSKFAALLAAIKQGRSMDQALQGTYGFDRTGLYNAWRDSVHLSGPGAAAGAGQDEAAPQATPPASTGRQNANATVEPVSPPKPVPQNGPGADRGALVLLLSLGASLGLLLIAAVVAIGLMLSRRTQG